jgi:hypothetical protein
MKTQGKVDIWVRFANFLSRACLAFRNYLISPEVVVYSIGLVSSNQDREREKGGSEKSVVSDLESAENSGIGA